MFRHSENNEVPGKHMTTEHVEKSIQEGIKSNLDTCVDLILYSEKSPKTNSKKRHRSEQSEPDDEDKKNKPKQTEKKIESPKSPMKTKSISKDNFFLFWN